MTWRRRAGLVGFAAASFVAGACLGGAAYYAHIYRIYWTNNRRRR